MNEQLEPESSPLPKPRLGSALRRQVCPVPRWLRLDASRLCAKAQSQAGLSDFGDPPLDPGFSILLDSLEHEAELHLIGRLLMRLHLLDLLQTRLRLTEEWKQSRHLLKGQRIERPIFIVGMPRSGSTFLHELLAEDPENRAPRVWEVMFPAGSTQANARDCARRIRKAEFCLWWFRRLAPRADSVFPMRAMTPHECVAIQSYTFLSEEFISTCRIPAYEAFLRAADLTPAYRWQKQFLQYLQVGSQARRWVMKSPDHVHGLEELFSVFPDAYIIQTHRNPLEVLQSSTDLSQVLHGLYGRPRGRDETFAREAQMLASHTEKSMRFRDQHPELQNRFVDVKYTETVRNPVATIRSIYEQLGITLTDQAAQRMQHLAASRAPYKGRRSSAEPVELKAETAAHAGSFRSYCMRFELQWQPTASMLDTEH